MLEPSGVMRIGCHHLDGKIQRSNTYDSLRYPSSFVAPRCVGYDMIRSNSRPEQSYYSILKWSIKCTCPGGVEVREVAMIGERMLAKVC